MYRFTLVEFAPDGENGKEPFEHFRQNFTAIPQDKIARIMAILAEPPAPQRKTRSDAGKPKAKPPTNQPDLIQP